MRPGDPARVGTVDITNAGSLSGVFTLQRGTVVDNDATYKLSTKLDLVVKDCGDFSNGTPACDAGDPTQVHGHHRRDEQRRRARHLRRRREAPLPVQRHGEHPADNDFQGKNSVVPFSWNAA